MNPNFDVYSIEWEYEDRLPESLTDIEYDHIYEKIGNKKRSKNVPLYHYLST